MVCMTRLVMLALLAVGCSGTWGRAAPTLNKIGAAASVAVLACDWGQTRYAAGRGAAGTWGQDTWEKGMARHAIGTSPSVASVDVYFAVASIAAIGLAQLVPEKARPLVYGAIVVGEVATIGGNWRTTETCGMGARVAAE
jgi:hypothetical protein